MCVLEHRKNKYLKQKKTVSHLNSWDILWQLLRLYVRRRDEIACNFHWWYAALSVQNWLLNPWLYESSCLTTILCKVNITEIWSFSQFKLWRVQTCKQNKANRNRMILEAWNWSLVILWLTHSNTIDTSQVVDLKITFTILYLPALTHYARVSRLQI